MNDFQNLVYNRWLTFPKGYSISIGDFGTITKADALRHVKENDKIGQILIKIDREFFDSLKTGEFYAGLNN